MPVFVQTEDFDLGGEVRKLYAADVGAVVSFCGIVRNTPSGDLTALELECYPAMAIASLNDILNQATRRWSLSSGLIIHRYGRLAVGDQIMMVATASAHRTHAFQAAEFLMDYLKNDAPFWKKEHSEQSATWVESKANDQHLQKRWDR